MHKKSGFQKNGFEKTGMIQRGHIFRITIVIAIASIYTCNARALPQGPSVASGSIDIVNKGRNMEINQTTGKAIINWQGFGIEAGETVNFIQPSSSSLILNRITGLDASFINGKMSANGQVFIINPNGVLFGENTQINAGGIIASTLGISDKDFMDGNFQFSKSSSLPSSVKNLGTVSASDGGYIVFLADEIKNSGELNVSGGRVLMGAGNQIAIYFAKDSLVGYALNRETANAIVENAGKIRAAGGTISLVANGMDDVTKNAVVNNTGIIEAKTLNNVRGKIELLADSQRGTVNLDGTLDASASDGPGGTIQASAARVSTGDSAVVTTHASNGKTGFLTINTSTGRIGTDASDIHANALSRNLASTNVTVSVRANSQAKSGDLVIDDAILSNAQNRLVLEADQNVLINAPVSIGNGGLKIRTDINGTSGGKLIFGRSGRIHAAAGSDVDIYTNVESFKNNTLYDNFITSPYRLWMLVNDAGQLQKINDNLSGNYALGRDIDAAETASWNQGPGYLPPNIWNYNTGFIPIAFNEVNQFSGKLDGLNHMISNLYINRPIGSKVGLFSSSTGEIKNLGLVDVNITGNDSVGAVAGYNNGNIHNVFVTGSISNNVKPGYSEIAPNSIGGIAGVNESMGNIENAYSLATVSEPFLVSAVGGIAGKNAGRIDSVYTVWHESKNGIAGMDSGKITNAYWTMDGNGPAGSIASDPGSNSYAGNGQLNADTLKTANLNFDFGETWTRYDGYTFPLLKSFLKPLEVLSVDTSVTKTYDGLTGKLQSKLLYSDANAAGSAHLYSTADADFNSLVNVGEVSYMNQKKFWSDQQGYYLDHRIIDQQVSMKVSARPLLVEAVSDTKQADASLKSSAAPQISKNYDSRNMGLAEGDVMNAQQIFDSDVPGNRTLQVSNVQINNAGGKNVTDDYQIVKLNGSGLILGRGSVSHPGDGPSNPPNNPDPTPQTPPQVEPGKPTENPGSPIPGASGESKGSSGSLANNGGAEGGDVHNGMGDNVNNGMESNGTKMENNGNNIAGTGNSGNSDGPLSGFNQMNSNSKLRNLFVWTSVDKDEEYRKRTGARKIQSPVSVFLRDGGMNLPNELTQ